VAYTTSDLITDIKLRAFVPTSQATFAESDLLLLADAEMQTTVLPLVLSLGQEYYVTYSSTTVVQGQAGYDLPARSVGLKLDRVLLIDTNGSVTALPQMEPIYQASTSQGLVESFYLQQNTLYLYPTPDQTALTLRMYYFLRPAKHVLTSAAAQISAIDTATNTVTVNGLPSTWSTTQTYDLVRQDGGSEPLGIDLVATGVGAGAVSFAASLPSSLRVGDYVSLSAETPCPQLVPELRPVLAQAVAKRIRMSMRLPGGDDAAAQLKLEVENARTLLTPRVESAAQVIMPAHRWF
jgi:hypothetical protein